MKELVSRGNAEWCDKTQQRALIYWRKPSEWATLIHNWVVASGNTDNVFTVFELIHGDLVSSEGSLALLLNNLFVSFSDDGMGQKSFMGWKQI